MKIEIPGAIVDQVVELCDLVRENPRTIRTEDAARFCGMDAESYRNAALRGAVPFAIAYRKTAGANACVRTAILPFYLSMMNINGQDIINAMGVAK